MAKLINFIFVIPVIFIRNFVPEITEILYLFNNLTIYNYPLVFNLCKVCLTFLSEVADFSNSVHHMPTAICLVWYHAVLYLV